jgi:adenylate kinase
LKQRILYAITQNFNALTLAIIGKNYIFTPYNNKYGIMLNIVIFGAPGSGKGTQSERILKKFGLNHISTGDVLRAEIKNDTEFGKIAQRYVNQGQLIPDALMIDILAKVLDQLKNSKGVIFDGFPRTAAQAEALKTMLAEREQEVSVMFDLDVPENELIARLIKRGQESGRADDNEETIKKRLSVYHSQTAPLINWYKKEGKYRHIKGNGSLDEITAEIVSNMPISSKG